MAAVLDDSFLMSLRVCSARVPLAHTMLITSNMDHILSHAYRIGQGQDQHQEDQSQSHGT